MLRQTIDSCKMKAGFRIPEKARHPGVFRVSTPSVDDIGRIRRRRHNPPSLRSFRKAGLNRLKIEIARQLISDNSINLYDSFPRTTSFKSIKAFTLVELMVVFFLSLLIVMAAYKVFFSQVKMVSQSVESIQVNENFRKIITFLSNDIHEATQIIAPAPIKLENVSRHKTKAGVALRLFKHEVDPTLEAQSWGQLAMRREVTYELIEIKPKPTDPQPDKIPKYKLIRTEVIEEKPGAKENQSHEIVDNIREFIVFRTIRKPMVVNNLNNLDDRLLSPLNSHEAGTGNNLINLKVVLERKRLSKVDVGDVYRIAMETSFYKRGKEVYANQ